MGASWEGNVNARELHLENKEGHPVRNERREGLNNKILPGKRDDALRGRAISQEQKKGKKDLSINKSMCG